MYREEGLNNSKNSITIISPSRAPDKVQYPQSQDNIHIIIDFANTRKPRISEAVANGQSIDLLVAPTVQKYIKEKQLYEVTRDVI